MNRLGAAPLGRVTLLCPIPVPFFNGFKQQIGFPFAEELAVVVREIAADIHPGFVDRTTVIDVEVLTRIRNENIPAIVLEKNVHAVRKEPADMICGVVIADRRIDFNRNITTTQSGALITIINACLSVMIFRHGVDSLFVLFENWGGRLRTHFLKKEKPLK